MTELKTERFVLRPVERSDAAAIARYCNDWSLARFTSRLPYPYTEEDAAWFVNNCEAAWASGDEYRFAVCSDDAMIACCGAAPKENGAFELGYWVGAPHRGRGVATEMVRALIGYAFAHHNAARITAGYFADNEASGRVLEKLGFQRTSDVVDTFSLARQTKVPTVRVLLEREKRPI